MPERNALRCVALLGHRDEPTDALEDYSKQLTAALQKKGYSVGIARVPWAERGWRRAICDMRTRFAAERGTWVLVQYTALSWSKRGFPLRFVSLIRMLKRSGLRTSIVFHEPEPYGGSRLIDRFRRRVQLGSMRRAACEADKIVSTLSPERISWMQEPAIRRKAIVLPVGSNLPPVLRTSQHLNARLPVVVVFGVTGSSAETDTIAAVVRGAGERIGPLQLTVFGRGGPEAAARLRPLLRASKVQLEDPGILEPERAAQVLADADVQLFVRSGVTSFRGSAIAGIACGLPLVGFSDAYTEFPVTEAGVRLVPRGDQEGLIRELVLVLQQPALREELRQRNFRASALYFSWDRIADAYASFLRDEQP